MLALAAPRDEITADIAREAADDILEDLKALNLNRRGAITLDFVDTVVSTAAYRAEGGHRSGMLSLVSAKSAALVGVFISVTTVPAAGFAIVAATVGDWDIAAKSAAQLLINLVGIVVAGVVVLAVYLRVTSHRRHARPG